VFITLAKEEKMDVVSSRLCELLELNYTDAQDHFTGFLEDLRTHKCMDKVLEHLDNVATALNVDIDIDEVESGFDALVCPKLEESKYGK
jgi:hypothetical protein